MTRRVPLAAMLVAALLPLAGAHAATPDSDGSHQFGVIGNSFDKSGGEEALKLAIAASSEPALSFVVVTGIKSASEPCSDNLYLERRELLEAARRPLIALPAASDWSECKSSAGRPAAIERLNRLRELLYAEPESLGRRKLALTRLSGNAKYRSYAENAHWIIGEVLYATVNLPANNNHYRAEAGRNSEFEDRAVANRFWLKRLFALAKRKKLDALVLFSEGDVKALRVESGLSALLGRNSGAQDGFAAPRRQIGTLAKTFPGKVLLIDTAAANGGDPAIEWRGNLGHVSVGSGALEVHVDPESGAIFTLKKADRESKYHRP